jgi:histidyl-tRNA synthetase
MQFDADTVGAAGPEADAEMCMMMADTMDALGLAGKYVVKVNNRKVLDGVLEMCGLSGSDNSARRMVVLRAIDKLDRLGADGVAALLGRGRRDESGDYTEGANLDSYAIERLLRFVGDRELDFSLVSARDQAGLGALKGSDEHYIDATTISLLKGTTEQGDLAFVDNATVLNRWRDVVGSSLVGNVGLDELDTIFSLTRASGFGSRRIKVDSSVVRGLEYYTGPVFEIELTFSVQNEKGQDVVFGSVGGGGRYDGLVSRFRSEPVPATGFSIGVSRLANALKLTGNLGATEPTGPVVVLVMDKAETARYQAITSALRKAGIRAEMFMGNTKNFGKQVAYADKRNAPAVIIEGSQEREAGIVQIKDLIVGKEAAAAITDNAEYKAARPGQFECKGDVASIVAAISELPAVAAYLKGNQ